MNSAPELIRIVESAGGRFLIDGNRLGVEPKSVAEPIVEQLRAHKREILDLLIGGSSYLEQCQNEDTGPWRADLRRWLEANCVSRPGKEDRTSVSCLLINFAEWGTTHNSIPCSRMIFEKLLTDAGFRLENGMASGLLLRADLLAHTEFRKYTEAADAKRDASKRKLSSKQSKDDAGK
jgi:hypothetical protein